VGLLNVPSVGIIIPAYNAARTLPDVLQRIPADRLAELGCAARVYVVDDGSTDGTAASETHAVRVLRHERNRGYGAALKTGLAASCGDGNALHVILHADGQYAPEELPQMLAPLLAGRADVVIGSKFLGGNVLAQGMPLSRMLGIRFFDWLENLRFGTDDLEFHSGYMAYSSAALGKLPFARLTDRFHFDGQMVAAAARLGLRVERVPITTDYSAGTSSLAAGPYVREILGTILGSDAQGLERGGEGNASGMRDRPASGMPDRPASGMRDRPASGMRGRASLAGFALVLASALALAWLVDSGRLGLLESGYTHAMQVANEDYHWVFNVSPERVDLDRRDMIQWGIFLYPVMPVAHLPGMVLQWLVPSARNAQFLHSVSLYLTMLLLSLAYFVARGRGLAVWVSATLTCITLCNPFLVALLLDAPATATTALLPLAMLAVLRRSTAGTAASLALLCFSYRLGAVLALVFFLAAREREQDPETRVFLGGVVKVLLAFTGIQVGVHVLLLAATAFFGGLEGPRLADALSRMLAFVRNPVAPDRLPRLLQGVGFLAAGGFALFLKPAGTFSRLLPWFALGYLLLVTGPFSQSMVFLVSMSALTLVDATAGLERTRPPLLVALLAAGVTATTLLLPVIDPGIDKVPHIPPQPSLLPLRQYTLPLLPPGTDPGWEEARRRSDAFEPLAAAVGNRDGGLRVDSSTPVATLADQSTPLAFYSRVARATDAGPHARRDRAIGTEGGAPGTEGLAGAPARRDRAIGTEGGAPGTEGLAGAHVERVREVLARVSGHLCLVDPYVLPFLSGSTCRLVVPMGKRASQEILGSVDLVLVDLSRHAVAFREHMARSESVGRQWGPSLVAAFELAFRSGRFREAEQADGLFVLTATTPGTRPAP